MKLYRVYDRNTHAEITEEISMDSSGQFWVIHSDIPLMRGRCFIEWIGPGKIVMGDGCFETFRRYNPEGYHKKIHPELYNL